jgi:hypothetical protein
VKEGRHTRIVNSPHNSKNIPHGQVNPFK